MEIIPAINCANLSCFRKRTAEAAKFIPKKGWIHVDISRSPFTPGNSVICVQTLKKFSKSVRFEGHLMAKWNRMSFLAYLRMPFDRIFIHSSQFRRKEDELRWALAEAKKHKKEIGLVYVAGEKAEKPEKGIQHVLVLAVRPGKSGQKFRPSAIKTIRFLKKNSPDVTITADGGIRPASLRGIFQAGASRVVSGSFIWDSKNHAEAFDSFRDASLR